MSAIPSFMQKPTGGTDATLASAPRSAQFRKRNEWEWRELDDIVTQGEKRSLKVLSQSDLLRLPVLYRHAVSSLLFAQQTALDRNLIAYLEALVGRSYLLIYTSRRPHAHPIKNFLVSEFPRDVRALRQELLISTIAFTTGVLLAYALVRADSSWYFAFVNPSLAGGRDPGATTEYLRSTLYDATDSGLAAFASFLFQNNASVALLAFATGIGAGLPSVLILFTNGLTTGALVALFASRGLLLPLCGWLLPHGVPEISAILLAGAGGIHIGRAMIAPGAAGVRAALSDAGKRGATVLVGVVLLLFFAGIIEGILRQQITNDGLRLTLASSLALALFSWLLWGGRSGSSSSETSLDRSGPRAPHSKGKLHAEAGSGTDRAFGGHAAR